MGKCNDRTIHLGSDLQGLFSVDKSLLKQNQVWASKQKAHIFANTNHGG
jgi:hypothetical protein